MPHPRPGSDYGLKALTDKKLTHLLWYGQETDYSL